MHRNTYLIVCSTFWRIFSIQCGGPLDKKKCHSASTNSHRCINKYIPICTQPWRGGARGRSAGTRTYVRRRTPVPTVVCLAVCCIDDL